MIPKRIQCLLFLCAWVYILGDVDAFNLQIFPERARLMQTERSWVTITCSADTSLEGCQFSWWAEKDTVGPVIDLSAGPKSKVNQSHINGELINYQYTGKGLVKGDCGLRMQLEGKKLWTVGCRARGKNGGWKYAWMELVAYATKLLPNVVTEHSTVVAFPGQDLNIMCSTTQAVNSCYFSVPGIPGWLDFARGLESKDSNGRHVCRGKGPSAGQCGLSLHKVTEEDNGPVRCYIWKSPSYADNRAIHVIVAKPPAAPILEVRYEDGKLSATCSVTGSRPVVDIRWVIDDKVVRNDEDNDADASFDDEWKWPWSPVSITQTYNRTLTDFDYGNVIKCVVSHATLEYPITLSQVLSKAAAKEKPRVTNAVATPTTRTRDVAGSSDCNMAASCQQKDEYCSLLLKEARHAAAAAALAEEANQVTLEAARAALKAEEARTLAEESRAREEATWEKNAVEELSVDQERRNITLRELRKTKARR